MNFKEVLEYFKAKESIEDCLILIPQNKDDDLAHALQKIVLAWPKINIIRDKGEIVSQGSEKEKWTNLWTGVEYDLGEIREISGVETYLEKKVKILIGNRLIYPDGTVSEFAGKVLRQLAKNAIN